MDIYKMFIDTTQRVSLTTLLGPTGGANIVKKFMRKEFENDYNENDIYNILKEGFYINETLNHMIYFLNKKHYKSKKIYKNSDLSVYSKFKYYINPVDEEEEINPANNCLMIPILKFLDVLGVKKQDNEYKPTKFIMLVSIRKEQEYCDQTYDTLEFARNIS